MVTTKYLCLFISLFFHYTSGVFFREDYHYIESMQSFYKIHTVGKPWLEAKQTCELEGATFFYPTSEEESAAVRAYVKREQNYYNYWIGIASLVTTGIFVTVDGLPLADVYHKWAQGDPNNLGGVEHCVLLEHTGLIYDGKCAQDLKFVCKKTLNSLHGDADSDIPISDGQPDRTFFRNDYHYIDSVESFYKIHTIGRPWLDAQRTCELEGATFFYPTSEEESAVVRAYVKQEQNFYNFWIGISSLVTTGVFVTTDGLPIADVYHKWAPGDPNNLGGVEHCVLLEHTGLIYDGNCAQNLRFVCKKTLNSLTWNMDCDLPYSDYKYNTELKKCYKFYLTPQNWMEAYRTCVSELSYLAIIDSPGELEYFVEQLSNATPKGKVGGEYQQGQFLVGVHQLTGEGWRTVKGTTLRATNGYSKWYTNQPDSRGRDKCASVIFKDGVGMNDIGCQRSGFFICEHDVTGNNTLPPYLSYGLI